MNAKPQDPEGLDELVSRTMDGIAEETARQQAAGQQAAEERRRRAVRQRVAAAVLVPLCLALTAWNLARAGSYGAGDAPTSVPAAAAQAAARELLRNAIEELQHDFAVNGSYPLIPGFIGPDGVDGDDEPFSYELIDGKRYVLSVTVRQATVTYDSRQDPDVVVRGGGAHR